MSTETDNTESVEQNSDDQEAQSMLADATSSRPEHPWDEPDAARAEILRLREENKTRRQTNEQLKPLADKWLEKERSEKSEAELLREELTKLREESAHNALEALRSKILADTGCPSDFAPLLTGSEDEMRQAATSLAERYGQSRQTPASGRPMPVLKSGQNSVGLPATMDDYLRGLGRR